MERRTFFRTLIGGIAAAAAVRTWPFRVYSFPTQVVAPEFTFDQISATTLAELREDILYDNFFVDTAWMAKMRSYGEVVKIDRVMGSVVDVTRGYPS